VSLFQSNLRKQIRKLPKILKSVKIIQYYSLVSLVETGRRSGPPSIHSRESSRVAPFHPLSWREEKNSSGNGAQSTCLHDTDKKFVQKTREKLLFQKKIPYFAGCGRPNEKRFLRFPDKILTWSKLSEIYL
jgi:hypothetical protein